MKLYKYYISISLFIFFANSIIAQENEDFGDFPYQESFLNRTTLPPGVEKPDPAGTTMTNSAAPSLEGLILTPDAFDRFGAIYLDNHKFKSRNGILIEFEYMIFSDKANEKDFGGDGLSLFFFDAKTADPNIGASGAGLGYTYNRSLLNTSANVYRAEGLRGAYMGVAFDSYGNFKELRFQGESRVSGLPLAYTSTGANDIRPAPGTDMTNHVTIRGARRLQGFTPPGMGVGFCGYPVLVSQSTLNDYGVKLKTVSNFAYTKEKLSIGKNYFKIRGGKKFEKPGDEGYRKAFVELYPNGDEGFFVSVMIEHDSKKDTIIYDYEYKKSLTYLENAVTDPLSNGDNVDQDVPRIAASAQTLDVPIPLELKIGLAAATGSGAMSGAKHDKHVIKNLGIRLPRSAEAYDGFLDDQYAGITVTFKPLLNDLAYKGLISKQQKGDPKNIDPTTFRFIKPDGKPSDDYYNYTDTDGGIWRYDETTGTVTYRHPDRTFTGKPRVKYSIKGLPDPPNPYANEAYRSLPATIGVNIIENPNKQKNIISNRMITNDVTG
ncbi:MAG: hypothetical protein LBU84_10235 [Prevotella sp.]|jgi:hypothetical protein|nr:hypothetical protein [Prevotella sp.]